MRVAAAREEIVCSDGRWTVQASAVRPASYPSVTGLRRLWEGTAHTLVAAEPQTGRRHQIRVHLAWIGHPIAGDPLFGGAGPRTSLHAWRLTFDDAAGQRVRVMADPGADFWAPVTGDGPPNQFGSPRWPASTSPFPGPAHGPPPGLGP